MTNLLTRNIKLTFSFVALTLLCVYVPQIQGESRGSLGTNSNLENSYGYVYVDSWQNGRCTEGFHSTSISNGEDRDITYTWEAHHEIVGWAHDPNAVDRTGGWGPTVPPGQYASENFYPYVVLDDIWNFPENGWVTVHSRTGIEAYEVDRPWKRDNWTVHRNLTFFLN